MFDNKIEDNLIASCVPENFEKMFVAATEFCRRNKSHRFSLI